MAALGGREVPSLGEGGRGVRVLPCMRGLDRILLTLGQRLLERW